MIKIGKVELQKNNKERFNLYDQDGNYIMAASAYNLKDYGYSEFEISEEDLEDLKRREDKDLIYLQASRYVSKALKTTKELENYLAKKKVDPSLIEEISYYLEDLGLLDDDKYLELYIEDRYNYSTDGPQKIKQKLYYKGFGSDQVDPLLAEYEDKERENLRELIISQKNTSRGKDKAKLIRYLMNKGYYYSMIKDELGIIDEI